MTGGDRITCRQMYCEPFDFKPQFKMVFCCNKLPPLPPDDEGIWRRISVVEFKSRFTNNPDPSNPYEFKRDYNLTDKLAMWKEAFMYIILAYYKIYKKHGLNEPQAVREATLEYQRTNDAYRDFIADCFEPDETSSAKLEDVFKIFKDWWKENFGGKAPSRKEMKACLMTKLGKYVSSAKGGWLGYKLIAWHGSSHRGGEDGEINETPEQIISTGTINATLSTTL